MSPVGRALIVLAVLALALGMAWLARQGVAIRRRPIALPAGMSAPVLFTSETCATCGRVRRMLDGMDVESLTEVVWEHQPDVFESVGITRVPVFVWSDAGGRTWRADGVVGATRLRRWLEGP